MTRTRKRLFSGGAVVLAAAGLLAATTVPAAARPTNRTFLSYQACEKQAALIRDGITGAECKKEIYGYVNVRWRLYVYD